MEWFEETLHGDWTQRLRVREVLYHAKTEHQDLIVFESFAWGRVLALDGVVQTTTGDEFVYHEMLVHTPVLAHGSVRDLLIIGGGDGGSLREALKHPAIRQITQVEIDAGVVDFCREYLPTLSEGAFDDPRVRLTIADGARYVAETEERYDVVVVNSTDPIGPGAVLFTEDFYRGCRHVLRPGGILVTQSGNPAVRSDELVDTQRRQAAAGFSDVSYYFAAVPTYVGGSMALGWASDDPARRVASAETIAARHVPAGLRYYTPEVHVAAFAHPVWLIERVGH